MNKRQIAEEEIKKALLLMKYDSKKTLTENIEDINENEKDLGLVGSSAAWGAGAGAAATIGGFALAGTTVGPIGTLVGAAIGATIFGVTAYMNQTGSYENTKKIISSCSSGVGKQTQTDDSLKNIANIIYQGIEGLGTDEEAIRDAIANCRTFPDFCKMAEIYQSEYNESLVDALDGDFHMPSDWQDYVYTPLRRCVERTEVAKPVTKDEDGNIVPLPDEDNEDNEGNKEDNKKKSTDWRECDFPLIKGCKGEKVKEIQNCLAGLTSDGKFGPKTEKAVENAGYGSDVSEDDYNKILKDCSKSSSTNGKETEPIIDYGPETSGDNSGSIE